MKVVFIYLPLPRQDNVGSCSNTQLVNGVAPVPDATRALYHGNQFLGNTLSKAVFPTAHIPPLRCSSYDPLNGSTSSLPLPKWDRNLKSDTTSGSTSLTSDAH